MAGRVILALVQDGELAVASDLAEREGWSLPIFEQHHRQRGRSERSRSGGWVASAAPARLYSFTTRQRVTTHDKQLFSMTSRTRLYRYTVSTSSHYQSTYG